MEHLMSNEELERISSLFDIEERVRGHGQRYKALLAVIDVELTEFCRELEKRQAEKQADPEKPASPEAAALATEEQVRTSPGMPVRAQPVSRPAPVQQPSTGFTGIQSGTVIERKV